MVAAIGTVRRYILLILTRSFVVATLTGEETNSSIRDWAPLIWMMLVGHQGWLAGVSFMQLHRLYTESRL